MSYIRIWVHCVWGTKSRYPFINETNRCKILDHICKMAGDKGIFIDFINAYKDHVHCLFSLNPDQSIGKILNLIKGESSRWINKNIAIDGRFEWADEFYAASVSNSMINRVREYIKDQEIHHSVISWKEEEIEIQSLISKNEISFAQAHD